METGPHPKGAAVSGEEPCRSRTPGPEPTSRAFGAETARHGRFEPELPRGKFSRHPSHILANTRENVSSPPDLIRRARSGERRDSRLVMVEGTDLGSNTLRFLSRSGAALPDSWFSDENWNSLPTGFEVPTFPDRHPGQAAVRSRVYGWWSRAEAKRGRAACGRLHLGSACPPPQPAVRRQPL